METIKAAFAVNIYDITIYNHIDKYVQDVLNGNAVYDLELMMNIVRNYQINTELVNVNTLETILVLSLTQLPGTDYLKMSYLLPKHLSTSNNLKIIQKCSDLLGTTYPFTSLIHTLTYFFNYQERCNFIEFWKISSELNLFSNKNVVDKIRLFILRIICQSYSEMSKDTYTKFLNLTSSTDIGTFNTANSSLVKENGGTIMISKFN